MALVIPNIQGITNGANGYDIQSIPDATDWAIRDASDQQSIYVVSGMQVTQHTGSDMLVSIAAGAYVINGGQYTYAGGTATVSAASATDRRDLISIDTSGTVNVTAGTACGTAEWVRSTLALPPVKPAIPSNQCSLAEVAVPAGMNAVTNLNIVDKRGIMGILWTPYTPTWTASPTNPVIGNGTISGRYVLLGPKTCLCRWTIVTGSSTTLGSGGYQVGHPFTSSNSITAGQLMGQGFMLNGLLPLFGS